MVADLECHPLVTTNENIVVCMYVNLVHKGARTYRDNLATQNDFVWHSRETSADSQHPLQ